MTNQAAPPRTTRITAVRAYDPRCIPLSARITNLDLDITKKCNLRCVYCFKGELAGMARPSMSLDVARAAVDWLIDGSGNADYLNVNFLGGEPTLVWKDVIEKLVPYTKRRAFALGKIVQFGTTTNLTRVTPEIVAFSAQWGMGWHLSIDGLPEVQLAQRLGGRSRQVQKIENAAQAILRYRPGFCARATFTPDYFSRLYDSYDYLRRLGFRNFGFACATQLISTNDADLWLSESERIVDDILDRARRGEFLEFGLVTFVFKALATGKPPPSSCGAGRGYVMIDQEGCIWPCHRWDGAAHDSGQASQWCLGNIFDGTFDDALHRRLLDRDAAKHNPRCANCEARDLCGRGCPAENLSTSASIDLPRESTCDLIRRSTRMMREKYESCRLEGDRNLQAYISSIDGSLANRARR